EALKIDYHAIFENSIYDQIQMSDELVSRLNDFLDEASDYDLSKIESDIIGRIYEGLIPKDERHILGQYYTPPAICDLIVKMCIKKYDDVVLDPGCGTGGFLIKAYHQLLSLRGRKKTDDKIHQEILSQLWGIDISQFPAHLSVINLALRNIRGKSDIINIIPNDFFKIIPKQKTFQNLESLSLNEKKGIYEIIPQFDAVICNPPYTRQDDIGDEKYRKFVRNIALRFNDKVNISKEAGIYAYFFTHSTHFLKQNGMFGYIVSNSWLDSKFGASIQKFFLNNFKIKAIIEFDRRAFAEAAINTIIIIAQKLTGNNYSDERNQNSVKFVRIKRSLKAKTIIQYIEKTKKSFEDETIRVTIIRQEDLYNDHKWMKYLQAPPIFFKLLNSEKISKLGDYAKVNVGIITYANDFFVLSKDDVTNWNIEPEYLRPVLTRTRDVTKVDILKSDIKNFLLYINEPKTDLKSTNALKYIKHGENKPIKITRGSMKGKTVIGYHNIPSFKRKKELWYSIRQRKPAPIIVPDLMWERNFAAWNKAKAFAIHAFYEISPNNQANTRILLGILNSSLITFFEEVWGRKALGEGAIRMMASEWLSLPILDLNKTSLKLKKRIEQAYLKLAKSIREKKEPNEEEKARSQLDDAVFSAIGISITERQQIYEAIKKLKSRRKRRRNAQVLVDHPETVKRKRKRKKISRHRPESPPLAKWFE
ncbi:MAG: class I SAM-dependent DNA methyltransferase, partial [Promethearchaeota archaeon]